MAGYQDTGSLKATFVERRMGFWFGLLLIALLINAAISYRAAYSLIVDERQVTHTQEVLTELSTVLSLLTDAETGTRGYVITNDRSYLAPYFSALSQIDDQLNKVRQ